jgi:hypothetical protein
MTKIFSFILSLLVDKRFSIRAYIRNMFKSEIYHNNYLNTISVVAVC